MRKYSYLMLKLFFHKVAWIFSKLAPEGFLKIGVIIISAFFTRSVCTYAATEHAVGCFQSFFHNILIRREAGKSFKLVAEVIFADKKLRCDCFKCHGFCEMLIYID